jgi:peptide/nickel transport system substrate-binding protein
MKLHVCAWIGALVLVVAGCVAPSPTSTGSRGGAAPDGAAAPSRMVIAVQSELTALRSQVTSISPGLVEFEEVVNAGLAGVDDSGRLHPRLAESVPTIDNGLWKVFPDGTMETIWVIRDRAKWHDGIPFTSDDVRFTVMQLGKDRELPAYRHLTYDSIDAIETPDARTAVVKWSKVNIDADKLLSTMGTPWPLPVAKHLMEKPLEGDKLNFMQHAYWGHEFVGTGPYRLRDWAIGSHLTVVANDEYVLGRPRIDEIELKFLPDLSALMANIVSGSVDATLGRGLSLEQGLQARELWKAGRVEMPSSSVIAVFPQFINPNPPQLADVRFRRAILHGIDRQALIDTLMRGESSVAHTFFNPKEPEYAEVERNIVRYEYDPQMAIGLLEQVGYVRGSDGMFARPDGQRLSVAFQAVSLDIQEKSLLAIADGMKRIGVAVDIEILTPQRVDDREYRANRSAYELSRTPNALSSFLSRNHGSQTPLPEDNYRRYTNKSRYQNAEFDGLIDAYFGTIPPRERNQVLGRIVQHMTENLNVIGLMYDVEPMAVGNRVTNLQPKKAELSSVTWNVHQWEVR